MRFDLAELQDNGVVRLRFKKPDGSFHREIRAPNADISDLPLETREAIVAHWTPERVSAYQAKEAARQAEIEQQLTPTTETFSRAVQSHLDGKARERKYDNGFTLASYAASTNPQWKSEAETFVAWRDAVWSYAYEQLDLVTSGQREVPTVEQFISELPELNW